MSAGLPAVDELRHIRFSGVAEQSVLRETLSARTDSAQGRQSAHHPPEDCDLPDEFICWVLCRAGLDPAAYRARPLRRRLPAFLRSLRVSSELQARLLLEAQPGLLSRAVSLLLLGVTEFFRDTPVFDYLRRMSLPEMIRRQGTLRVWSAGCSGGQELYSVAILLDQMGVIDRCELLGTDCRADAVRSAEQGLFSVLEIGQMDEAIRCRYFAAEGRGYRAMESLRGRLCWRMADALLAAEEGPWDMVLCRNVAIYLQPAVAERLWRRLAEGLRPGGILVLGKAERPPAGTGLAFLSGCIYRKLAE